MRRARLQIRVRLQRVGVPCLGGRLPLHRLELGSLRAGREAGGPRGRFPAMALPPRDDGRARDRLQARQRRHLRRELPAASARRRALPRALARAHRALAMGEVELKLEIAPEEHARFEKLEALSGSAPTRTRLTALYFDTPAHDLEKNEMAMRLRRS